MRDARNGAITVTTALPMSGAESAAAAEGRITVTIYDESGEEVAVASVSFVRWTQATLGHLANTPATVRIGKQYGPDA